MTFIQYDKKEENTTVGMPELQPVDPIDEKSVADEKAQEGLAEDVYAFIVGAPFCSAPFIYALSVILIKYLVYSVLCSGIVGDRASFHTSPAKVQAVKFLLIPVAIAMQEDLIHVYAYAANVKYDKKVLEVSQDATMVKLVLGILLRLVDGLFSLSVNFFVMLQTHDSVIQVFLNFAALHFLQSIDDVFFILLTQGYFGDGMELMTEKCKHIVFPRRKTNSCAKKLDTFLFTFTFAVMVAIYGVVTAVPAPPE